MLLNENFIIVSLLLITILVTLIGGLFVIVKLCKDKEQVEVGYVARRRE